ncbi:hypothetical protein [Alkalihalobacterium alkalinitrilicum]|nr:hypothetical protein [Alkalihalobacterium alkalinitrilicum]
MSNIIHKHSYYRGVEHGAILHEFTSTCRDASSYKALREEETMTS